MSKPTLYLFVGYPGSGKTTVANFICQATGAVHIWADRERQAMFGRPTHSPAESKRLYDHLNQRTAQLLREGKSVVFDTNFNFRRDRDYLRAIADAAGAKTQIIRMTTATPLARQRALHGNHAERNGMAAAMTAQTFTSIAEHLEPLDASEPAITIKGENLDLEMVRAALQLEETDE